MKKIILILTLLAFSLNQVFAEELSRFYVKLKSGSVAQIEVMGIKAFGENYCDYDDEREFFNFECTQLAKYKFLDELRKLDMIVEEAKEEKEANSYFISMKQEPVIEELDIDGNLYSFDTSKFRARHLVELQKIFGTGIRGFRTDKVLVKDEDMVSIKKSLEDLGFVCTFTANSVTVKEIEYALYLEFDSSIKREVFGVLRNYAFNIRDLDSSFSFYLKKSNLKFLTEALKGLKEVESLSMRDNSTMVLRSKDMLEYRVRIYLSSKQDVLDMMESLRASKGYIIDDAFKNEQAGTLSLELKVLSYDMSENKIKSDITQKAKHINSDLSDRDVKIDKVLNE